MLDDRPEFLPADAALPPASHQAPAELGFDLSRHAPIEFCGGRVIRGRTDATPRAGELAARKAFYARNALQLAQFSGLAGTAPRFKLRPGQRRTF